MDNKNLLKGTMVYSLMNLVTKMGSFVFLPIITRLLTQEEFGIVGTLAPITSLFTVILGLGLYNAQMKKYVDLKENEDEFGSYMFSSTLIIVVFNILTYIFLFTPMAQKLFSYIVNLSKVSYYPLIIVSILIATANAFNNLSTTLFRMKRMYMKVAIGSVISLFTTYILAIYFIKYLKWGVFGNQFANLIALLIVFLFYFKDYFGKFRFKLNFDYVKYSLRNGLPLIFIELTDQVVNLSDRLVLAKFVSLAVVGGYTLAFTGGRVLSVVTGSFVNSWTPEFYEAMKEDKTNPTITRSVENFIAIISFACVIAQLFAPEGIKLIFPKSYYQAINYMPLILAGIVIQALFCLDYFFHFHEDSIYIFYFTMFAMIFNLAGNIIFIPKFPEIGPIIAAWTTLLAFSFRAIMEMMIIRKKYKISLVKFGLKIVYLVIVTKLLVNKEVLTKIMNLVNGIKGKIMKQ